MKTGQLLPRAMPHEIAVLAPQTHDSLVRGLGRGDRLAGLGLGPSGQPLREQRMPELGHTDAGVTDETEAIATAGAPPDTFKA